MFEECIKKVIEGDVVEDQSVWVRDAIEKAIVGGAGVPYTSADINNISQALVTLRASKKEKRWTDSFGPLAVATIELEKNF